MVAKLQKENEELRSKLERLQSQLNEQGYDWVGSASNAAGPVSLLSTSGAEAWGGATGGEWRWGRARRRGRRLESRSDLFQAINNESRSS